MNPILKVHIFRLHFTWSVSIKILIVMNKGILNAQMYADKILWVNWFSCSNLYIFENRSAWVISPRRKHSIGISTLDFQLFIFLKQDPKHDFVLHFNEDKPDGINGALKLVIMEWRFLFSSIIPPPRPSPSLKRIPQSKYN